MSPARLLTRAALLALAAATVACGNNPPAVGARLASPAAFVAFSGVTTKAPAQVKPYFAVASARGDELRFIDQYDLIVVVGPGLVFPLSVNTEVRPVLLASASLGDGGADVLAAVSAGHRSLQVVNTWATQNVVASEVSLESVLKPDAEVTGLIGVPARPATATTAATPARIVLTVNDADLSSGSYGPQTGKLVTVEFDRASDGSGAVVARAVDPVTSVKVLGFRATDLALEPDGLPASDGSRAPGTHVYVASTDPIAGTTYGIAQLDTTAPHASDWTVTAFDARGPTAAVGAGWVDDRVIDSTDYCSTERFQGAPHLEILAALHPSGCGVDQPIACGLATLDPATGTLALDPAAGVTLPPDPVPGGATAVPVQPYRAPMPIPGLPTHIAVLNPPAVGSPPQRLITETDSNISNNDCPTTGTGVFPLFRLSSGSGTRYTSAMAVVTTSAGYTYEYDLARWAPTSSVRTIVDGTYRVQVTALANYQTSASSATIGVWDDTTSPPGLVTISSDSTRTLNAIQVWPGFTDGDVWSVTYQGQLPQLGWQPGVVVSGAGGIYAAFQVDLANGKALTDPARFLATTKVSDPALGVHVGDTLEIVDAANGHLCESTIAAVLTPAAAAGVAGIALPAGALQFAADDPCLAPRASAAGAAWRMTVRTPGLVLINNKLGYLGRPEITDSTDTDPTHGVFAVAWSDETALAADTSAAGQEKLALARKARRLFYPAADGPCPPRTLAYNQTSARLGCYYGYPRLSDPLQPGPIIRFRLGLYTGTLTRGDAIVFTTQAGFTQTFRVPLNGGASPAAVVPFDWGSRNTTSDHVNDPIRYLVTYLDDQIVGFAPTGTAADFYVR